MAKKMKIYAIMIGRKDRNLRYICSHHLPSNAITSECPLAIYEDYQIAKKARKIILSECGHKDVYIIPFEQKEVS